MGKGVERTYGLPESVLRWLERTVRPEWRTLETGCGLSTIVFAACSGEHTTISPFASESDRVRRWCAERGVPTDHVTFIDDHSEWVLPKSDLGELNLVLVDGAHGDSEPNLMLHDTPRSTDGRPTSSCSVTVSSYTRGSAARRARSGGCCAGRGEPIIE